MDIKEAISQLQAYQGPLGLSLHTGGTEYELLKVEETYGITLPDDLREFYLFSDGLETEEDIFNIIPLKELIGNFEDRHESDGMFIAEYMIYSDMWQLAINPDNPNDYIIFIDAHDNKLVLTNSLGEFISRFLHGGVFFEGGLYDWQEEVERLPIYPTSLKVSKVLLTVFYRGLSLNIISKEEVTAWADSLVKHENEPDIFFINLCLCHDKAEMMDLLATEKVSDDEVVSRALLGLLYQKFSSGFINEDTILAVTRDYPFYDFLIGEEMADIYNWEQLSPEEQRQDMLKFLASYKDITVDSYKIWYGQTYRVKYLIEKERPVQKENTETNKSVRGQAAEFAIYLILGLAVPAGAILLTYNNSSGTSTDGFHNGNFNGSTTLICIITYWLLKGSLKAYIKLRLMMTK